MRTQYPGGPRVQIDDPGGATIPGQQMHIVRRNRHVRQRDRSCLGLQQANDRHALSASQIEHERVGVHVRCSDQHPINSRAAPKLDAGWKDRGRYIRRKTDRQRRSIVCIDNRKRGVGLDNRLTGCTRRPGCLWLTADCIGEETRAGNRIGEKECAIAIQQKQTAAVRSRVLRRSMPDAWCGEEHRSGNKCAACNCASRHP